MSEKSPHAMPAILRWAQHHPLAGYLWITFGFSWGLWLFPLWIHLDDPLTFRHLVSIGAFGPALGGLVMTMLSSQQREKPRSMEPFFLAFLAVGVLYFICLPYASALPLEASLSGWLARFFLFLAAAGVILVFFTSGMARRPFQQASTSHPLVWYAIAILVYPFLLASGLLLSAALGQTLEVTLPAREWPLLLWRVLTSFTYIFLFGGPLGEEPGWRGFALPQLQQKFSPLWASLLIGVIWGIWHIPMHLNGFYPSAGPQNLPWELGIRLLTTTLVSFLYTWMYNRTSGNLLVCTLLHASFNTASAWMESTPISIAFLAGVVLVLIITGKMWRKIDPQERNK
ncbi:MAG TPA: hypothetical protein DEQ80_02890 [Anaerolinea thermolimosa]|uniref:CAAX prenyl protease 2/Lysostaphin resistance protein A-like domain-containing protein n=1 Tax=Anaerolinea thermolimosa TaxID=229919 RepID=A0A3D1JGQ7_9CHLR|nr:type II CAAX endopeptidase family protein [Anaerolinea thermolimosa]GAP05606.1 CAAX protease self-immunity [Anaerolinea thermolimosa]HCE16786.1 hypothetical protein [Anaerolinea thermolimosa]